ncbi:UDP-N-acetylgalactosamine-undecaprenyl-phosphate N-acetylgalactosaminephosphotransferase [Gemmata sp. SH-PL17]|nr:UDP-N-acetylgalactosamine-undecaprenyl-phosphate N-acetylgalactosaminephosphotransferase [Gemmata sp. SH-PL17]
MNVKRMSPARDKQRSALRTPAPHVARLRSVNVAPSVPPLSARERVKTATDFVSAALMLAPALPVILACVALVRLTSPGPALYTQSRVGRGGRVFTLYKIRTMHHDCERLTGPQWSTPGDARVTPVGRVMRKLHLDELPQLFNVLKGEMSLVGPRPERPEIVKKLREAVAGYDRRHAVKPGITGFAQIHLPPDSCIRSVRNKVAYDRFYIRSRSLGMELFILGATALKVVGLKHLYYRAPRVPTE